MKRFDEIVIDKDQAKQEIEEFEKLLNSKTDFEEQSELLPFFKARKQLCLAIVDLLPESGKAQYYAHEFDLFGDFRADFCVGSKNPYSFVFVELEDANAFSLFKPSDRNRDYWSQRLEAGYSQISDWFWYLDSLASSNQLQDKFFDSSIDYQGMLILGRSSYLTADQRKRLDWRSRNTIVNSKRIRILTYDDLLQLLKSKSRYFDVK